MRNHTVFEIRTLLVDTRFPSERHVRYIVRGKTNNNGGSRLKIGLEARGG